MGKDLILLVVGGLTAGLLFGSISTGSLAAAFLLYFAAAPLFLVGLSLGWLPAAAAALVGAAVVTVMLGLLAAGNFALAVGLPAALLCRQALLSRPDGQGGAEWYPPGRLAALLAGLAAAILAGMCVFALLRGVDPREAVQQAVEAVLNAGLPPEVAERAAEQGLAGQIGSVLPGVSAAMIYIALAFDGVLAQGIAARLGIARRPTPAWRAIALPSWLTVALGVCCLGAIAGGGLLEYIARNLAVVLAVPFLLQGLAVVHSLASRLPGRAVWLVGFYLLAIVMAWPFLLVAALGLAEPYAALRTRFGGGAKENE